MPDFVLVRHDNGLIGPMEQARAKRLKLDVVEGEATDLTGRPVKPFRANGRKAKPKTTVAKKAAAKKAAAKATPKAVTPDEGAADNTLTNNKE